MALTTEEILDYQVACQGVECCTESIASWIDQGESCRWLACLNPHSYMMSLDDPVFLDALHSADWLIPDGVGILLASWFLKGGIRTRVTGSCVFAGVHELLNRSGGSVFFLGATETTLGKIRARMAIDYPNIRIAGTYSPPFKSMYSEEENAAILSVINSAAPDVLWVGMTAPKQEKWIYENRGELQVKFAGAVGAVFDFYAGRVKRSHPVFQRMGLEWLPRLLREPLRLWRRSFVSAPLFIMLVVRKRWQRSFHTSRDVQS